MKSDVLERLLIDRAAGELLPDVEDLLEAHLQREPAARKEAAEIEETMRLARLALAGQPAVTVLPTARGNRFPAWACAMAACFVCGLSLGLLVMRARLAPAQAAIAPARETAAIMPADESGFWSVRRFRAGLTSSTPKAEDRIIWKSLVKKPELPLL
jgi:anti-sigma factor RsiW